MDGFAGENTFDLRKAIKVESELTHSTRRLKFFVTGSDGTEIDLDDMQDLRDERGYFNFKQLVVDYKIKPRNPILVKLRGK